MSLVRGETAIEAAIPLIDWREEEFIGINADRQVLETSLHETLFEDVRARDVYISGQAVSDAIKQKRVRTTVHAAAVVGVERWATFADKLVRVYKQRDDEITKDSVALLADEALNTRGFTKRKARQRLGHIAMLVAEGPEAIQVQLFDKPRRKKQDGQFFWLRSAKREGDMGLSKMAGSGPTFVLPLDKLRLAGFGEILAAHSSSAGPNPESVKQYTEQSLQVDLLFAGRQLGVLGTAVDLLSIGERVGPEKPQHNL